METKKQVNNLNMRSEAEAKKIPVIELLMRKIEKLSKKENKNCTLFAVCPNSENVLKASLRAAKRANSPILFAATLNQVDFDGGYTGWTPKDLVKKIKDESYSIGFEGPTLICIDHGGPYVKDIQTLERWNLEKSTNWVKKSFEAAVLAGYDLLHIDTTVDIFEKKMEINKVVDRTLDIILHVENFLKKNKIKPISYEVGTEEVQGGLADINVFEEFLKLLKEGLKRNNLHYTWPIFIVAKVGTDLHTTNFDSSMAKVVKRIAAGYDSYIKGHYTDFVANPGDYPKSGIGAANVGPEFTILEYEALDKLSNIEDDLYKIGRLSTKSNFKDILEKAVIDSNRWKKWLKNGEKDLKSLKKDRKDFIFKSSCRYVLANPEIKESQKILYKNLNSIGINANSWVLLNIEAGMDNYFREFNLINLNSRIANY